MNIRTGELHPLENTLVLKHIFQRCSLKDLVSCRLVSRLWRDSSQLAWRSSAVVKTDPSTVGSTIRDFRLFSKRLDLGQGQMQITDTPFTNFHLRIEDSRWFYKFWGSSIKVLKLESIKFESRQVIVQTIFNLCQNLEKLTVVRVTFTSGNVNDQIKWNEIQEIKKLKSITLDTTQFDWEASAWIKFLVRLPSLQDIKLEGHVSICEQFFRSVKTVRERYPNKLNLKLIDIQELRDISPAIIPVLLDVNIHLKYLYLGPTFFDEGLNNSLPDILNNHSSSLKKLTLEGNCDPAVSNDFHLSSQKQLENLEELSIHFFQNEDYSLIKFLKLSPNVRKVKFCSFSAKYLGFADLDLSGPQDIRLNWCTELGLRVPPLTVQDLEHLISVMPNLKKLMFGRLNNETFSTICQGWSKLEVLEVLNSNVDDSGITGLDAEDVRTINRNGRMDVWRPTTVPRANITCLKELQTFRLDAYFLDGTRLGYCAAAFGIELLPNLKRLSIYRFDEQGPERAIWRNLNAPYPWV